MSGRSEPHIAVFTKNRVNPAYAAARLGADRTAARLGARTSHFVPDKPDDVQQQIALVEQALAQHPDAIVFVPVHETEVNRAVAAINAAGIPLFNCINRISTGNSVTFVGSDDKPLAMAVAERLFRHLGGRGDIVIMEGTPGSVTSKARLDGFQEAARASHGIRVARVCAGDYQQQRGREVMERLLAGGLHIEGLLCANDTMALGAIEAMTAAGCAIPVVGVNALPEAIEAIKRGSLLATVDFDALKMGCLATEAAIRYLRHQPVPRQIMLPVQVIDASNCAPWDRPLEERECPRWEDVVRA